LINIVITDFGRTPHAVRGMPPVRFERRLPKKNRKMRAVSRIEATENMPKNNKLPLKTVSYSIGTAVAIDTCELTIDSTGEHHGRCNVERHNL
jgi:hypothetical protein